jgi:hypothetical protein
MGCFILGRIVQGRFVRARIVRVPANTTLIVQESALLSPTHLSIILCTEAGF